MGIQFVPEDFAIFNHSHEQMEIIVERLNLLVPWFLTSFALLSIAIGLKESPTSMSPSALPDYGLNWRQDDIEFNGREVDCQGHREKDAVYKIVGLTEFKKNPTVILTRTYPITFNPGDFEVLVH